MAQISVKYKRNNTKTKNYHKTHNNKLPANQSLLLRADNSVYLLFVKQLQNQQHTSTILFFSHRNYMQMHTHK